MFSQFWLKSLFIKLLMIKVDQLDCAQPEYERAHHIKELLALMFVHSPDYNFIIIFHID